MLLDFEKRFVIEADASGSGLGATLLQEQRPMTFFSQTLSPRAEVKSVYERELMAIVLAIQKWRHYLLGRRFSVRTDQSSLKNLMEQTEVFPRYQLWVTKHLGYDFDIKYKSGKYNKVVDALSRKGPVAKLTHISMRAIIDVETIQREVDEDESLQKIIEELKEDPLQHPKYTIEHGKLLYKGRLVISSSSNLINNILHTYHDSVMGGHFRFIRTYKRLIGELYWSNMKRDVQRHVEACDTCQRNKSDLVARGGLLQPTITHS